MTKQHWLILALIAVDVVALAPRWGGGIVIRGEDRILIHREKVKVPQRLTLEQMRIFVTRQADQNVTITCDHMKPIVVTDARTLAWVWDGNWLTVQAQRWWDEPGDGVGEKLVSLPVYQRYIANPAACILQRGAQP